MAGKLMSLAEAAALIPDGAQICAVLDGPPVALLKELIRQRRRNLHVVQAPSAGWAADLLVGAGAAAVVEAGAVALEEGGVPPYFRRGTQSGTVKALDSTCPAVLAGLQASVMGIPYIPVPGLIGSDLLKVRRDFQIVENPFRPGEQTVVVPALTPDFGLLHAYQADGRGNAAIDRRTDGQLIAEASRTVIVTAERIVEGTLTRAAMEPEQQLVASIHVQAVVEAPGGARPGKFEGLYEEDADEIAFYLQCAQAGEFERYLERYVLAPAVMR